MICRHDENLDVSECIKLNVSSTTSYLMMRDRSVEHVDADDGVADHEEDSAEEHSPVPANP